MRNAGMWSLAVVALVLSFSVARGQRAEDKTVEEKMKERRAQVAGAEQPARRLTTVYLRGDAVGQHLNYTPPSPTNMPSVQGELTRMDAEWVVLTNRSGKQSMIARSAVLMVVMEGQ